MTIDGSWPAVYSGSIYREGMREGTSGQAIFPGGREGPKTPGGVCELLQDGLYSEGIRTP